MSKILIVDDLPDNRDLLQAVLSSSDENYVITEVGSGEEALEAIKKEAPDIILLDIMMPGLNGFEVCEKLKADEKYRSIPILFITAMAGMDEKIKGFQVGGADYITKPIDLNEVLARVKAHLRVREAEAERLQSKQIETAKNMIITYNHEMNQPLTAIQGYVDLLMDDVKKNDENYETFKTLKEQTDRLVKILDKIKSLETIETTEYIPGKTMIDLKLEEDDDKTPEH